MILSAPRWTRIGSGESPPQPSGGADISNPASLDTRLRIVPLRATDDSSAGCRLIGGAEAVDALGQCVVVDGEVGLTRGIGDRPAIGRAYAVVAP